MLDLILIVDNVYQWHFENLNRNAHHYAGWIRAFGGARSATLLQELGSAGVFFNPFAGLNDGRLVKYGVVSKRALVDDLDQWSALYLAGRLHKPVGWLAMDDALHSSIERNLLLACRSALILSSGKTVLTKQSFFEQIVALSYSGDVRMALAENPKKISNIVSPNIDRFEGLYRQSMLKCGIISRPDSAYLLRNTNSRLLLEHACQLAPVLPEVAHRAILALESPYTSDQSLLDVKSGLANELAGRVARSSRQQTVKGIFSAGPVKSILYATEKLRKRWLQ